MNAEKPEGAFVSGQYAELVEKRIPAAIERITSGMAPMRIPVDNTDPDIVLAEAASALTTLTQQLDKANDGLIEYARDIVAAESKLKQMGDKALPIANGGASTTASDIPSYEAIADMLPSILSDASAQCPLCGQRGFHQHSAQEIIIYRNGVKYGRARLLS